ncbi:sensor histidine kinase [Paenibacillus sabinae]|nr:HAMP domain-containing sensor histidine kinase [Paenibacillus sabinae]
MKLRSLILLSYAVGVMTVSIILGVSVRMMILETRTAVYAMIVALVASTIAFSINFALLRPAFRSFRKLSAASRKIAQGEFDETLEINGPFETKAMAEDFNEMARRLDSMFKQIREGEQDRKDLIANLSHDIKTPMASIRSFSEALLDDLVTDEADKRQYIRTIHRETIRLNHLVDELMQVTEIDRQEHPLKITRIWLDSLIVHVLQTFDAQLKREHRDVRVRVRADIASFYGDFNIICRILYNLIENALKFSDPGTDVEIEVQSDLDTIRFHVKDYGMGIPQEEQDKIFARLYRIEKSRNIKHGGSGLGLHIARSLAELLGGTLTVVSKPGDGSTFTLSVPDRQHG